MISWALFIVTPSVRNSIYNTRFCFYYQIMVPTEEIRNSTKPMRKRRRKLHQPPQSPGTILSSAAKKTQEPTSSSLKGPVAQNSQVDFKIQLAKNFAVAQAQQDGCTANFRILDSPFGNFLLPVIPTPADLIG